MSPISKSSSVLAVMLALSACTTMPTGPSVLALPGTGKSFDQFRADETDCRQYANEQMGGKSAADAATDSGIRSAIVGTVVGAAAGAAIGGRNGTGVGAGTGLLVGSMSGAGAAQASGRDAQRRYDYSYQQCMYAKGNRVPVSGNFATMPSQGQSRQPDSYGPPPSYYAPPPPPGYPR